MHVTMSHQKKTTQLVAPSVELETCHGGNAALSLEDGLLVEGLVHDIYYKG